MTRYGKAFVVAALVCAGLLSGGSVARGEEGGAEDRKKLMEAAPPTVGLEPEVMKQA